MPELQAAIENFATFLLEYFVVLAAAGALAMALVELYKKVNDARTRFHTTAVTGWFQEWTGQRTNALGELLHLTCGVSKEESLRQAGCLLSKNGRRSGVLWLPLRRHNAAFAMELERMMATFQESADLALTSPHTYVHLFEFVTEAADQSDRTNWTNLTATPPSDPTPAEMQLRAETHQRLRQASLRKLEAFQTFTSMRWVNRQQFWANIIGTAVLLTAFANTNIQWSDWPFVVAFSVLGGMLAPVAKDIVVALQQVRQPRP